jgi:hypothetical protein
MEERKAPVPLSGATPGNYVDDSAGAMSEFRFVTSRQHLKLEDRILIKGGGGSAIDSITIWHAVNEENGVSTPLPQNGHGSVGSLVDTPIDRNPRDQLKQVKIVTPIDWHLLNLLRGNRGAGRGTGSLEEWRIRGNCDLSAYGAKGEHNVES